MAGTDTITIYRGEAVDLGFTMNPLEVITGWSILFEIEHTSIRKAGSVTNGPAGTFTIPLTHNDTDDLVPGVYHYDVWHSDPGSERVIASGVFIVNEAAQLP